MDERKHLKVFLFTGYTPEAYEIIKRLIESEAGLCGVTFSPDVHQKYSWKRKLKFILTTFSTKEPGPLLRKNGIKYTFVKNHNSEKSEKYLKDSRTDLLLLYGTKIIKKNILDIPRIGTLNSHSSLLPKYRGGKSEFWILYNNEPEYAGVTIHWVTPGLDEGDIYLQEKLIVKKGETPSSLRKRSVPLTAKLFVKVIRQISDGKIVRIKQDDSVATKYKWPTEEEIIKYKEKHERR